jgi:ABC-type uncharacterized transport system fused permease/ATPase subunit
MKKLRQTNKDFRILIWTIFNGVVAFALSYLVLPEYAEYSVFLIPFLNILTKRVNNRYFGDLGMPVKELPPITE